MGASVIVQLFGLGKLEELETDEEKKLLGSVIESMLQNRRMIPSLFPVSTYSSNLDHSIPK